MSRKTNTVTFRASAVLQRRLDQLAAARGLNRSRAIQAAIVEATMPDASGVPSEAEVLELLGETARAGNVAAMKELRKYHRERATRKDDPFAEFDELAQRRVRRT
jgi:predicted transcriptional regulator